MKNEVVTERERWLMKLAWDEGQDVLEGSAPIDFDWWMGSYDGQEDMTAAPPRPRWRLHTEPVPDKWPDHEMILIDHGTWVESHKVSYVRHNGLAVLGAIRWCRWSALDAMLGGGK